MILFGPEIERIIHNKLVYENQQTLSREDQVFSRKEHMQKVKMQPSSLDFFFGHTKGISGSEAIQNVVVCYVRDTWHSLPSGWQLPSQLHAHGEENILQITL